MTLPSTMTPSSPLTSFSVVANAPVFADAVAVSNAPAITKSNNKLARKLTLLTFRKSITFDVQEEEKDSSPFLTIHARDKDGRRSLPQPSTSCHIPARVRDAATTPLPSSPSSTISSHSQKTLASQSSASRSDSQPSQLSCLKLQIRCWCEIMHKAFWKQRAKYIAEWTQTLDALVQVWNLNPATEEILRHCLQTPSYDKPCLVEKKGK